MSPRINYSQVWEDPRVLLAALKPAAGETFLAITSGGDNVLALLMTGARVHAIDLNPAQNHLLRLKLVAAGTLAYEDYLEFLGVRESRERLKFYAALRHQLPSETAEWWDSKRALIRRGLIHSGRFERYVARFARYVLPCLVSRNRLAALLSSKDPEQQSQLYAACFSGMLWNTLYALATSRRVLVLCARPRMMFAESDGLSTSSIYRERLERLIRTVPLHDNFFLHYSALGRYQETLPPYLTPEGHAALGKVPLGNLLISTATLSAHLRSVPSDTYAGLCLSDIGDALPLEEFEALWPEMIRTARHGASVIYWSNLVHHAVPRSIESHVRTDAGSVTWLRAMDRVFFYETVYVHSIHKP